MYRQKTFLIFPYAFIMNQICFLRNNRRNKKMVLWVSQANEKRVEGLNYEKLQNLNF